ncbi:hypothetical protein B0H14DRAFT_3457669 [Mycena olivaceomarginata]|nr:hypothetical protein B0H14DRAFT_3457669 [Mycena olivaceomarginata]
MTFGPNVNIDRPHTFSCPICKRRVSLKKCTNGGENHGRYFLACFHPSHLTRWHWFDRGVVPGASTAPILPGLAPATAPPPERPRCADRSVCSKPANQGCPSSIPNPTRSLLHQTSAIRTPTPARTTSNTRSLPTSAPARLTPNDRTLSPHFLAHLGALSAEALAPIRQTSNAARLAELHRLQEEAAFLASLPSLPSSPTQSQEAMDKQLAVSLAFEDSTPPPSPPSLPVASSSRSLLPPPTRRIVLIYWSIKHRSATVTAVQDRPEWSHTWPSVQLAHCLEFVHNDSHVECYSIHYQSWMRIPLTYAHTVTTDQPLLIRRIGVVGSGEDEHIRHLRKFLAGSFHLASPSRPSSHLSSSSSHLSSSSSHLSSSSSSRPSSPPPLRVSTSPPPATRKRRQSVIDLTSDSDDEIYVVATCIKQEPRTPPRHSYKRRITTSTPPSLSRSLDTSTSFLSLPSPGLSSPFPVVLMPWKK